MKIQGGLKLDVGPLFLFFVSFLLTKPGDCMDLEYIITHGYNAHYDEVLSVGLLVSMSGVVPVYRRTPKLDELEDPRIAVVDTGLEHAPQKHNWDHHQLSDTHVGPDGIPDCSFSLLARDFSIEEFFSYTTWYRKMRHIDARGGYSWARKMGLEIPLPREVLSDPVGQAVRAEFEKSWGNRPVDANLVVMLSNWVNNLEKHGKKLLKEVTSIREYGQEVDIGGARGIWVDFEAKIGMVEYIEELRRVGREIHFTINRSSEGGWFVHRIDNFERMNLHALEGEKEVESLNSQGRFVRLMPGTPWARVKELVANTISTPVGGTE